MRQALRPNKPRARVSEAETLPAPIQGWDAISPIAKMDPRRALVLDNWFPQPGYCELRKGFQEHVDTAEALPVESLMVYNGLSSSKMFGACHNKVFNVTAAGAPTSDMTGMANDRWQHINVATSGGNFLWMCNGADVPRYYDGSSWAQTVITGITPTQIVNAVLHKGRIWMARVDKLDAAYLPSDSIQGAATNFPLAGVFRKGGYLQAIGTWTVDGGSGPDDYIVFLSSEGEAAVYSGVTPGSDYAIKGLYEIAKPIGRRCLKKVGGDIAVLTVDGVLPLSQALTTDRANSFAIAMSRNIHPVIVQSARDYGANFGWEMCVYPRGTRAIVNIPIGVNDSQQQYVMNTVTGAWCRFTAMEANCWAVLNDKLYFGGNDGRVIEADRGGGDEANAITADMKTAFWYFGGERGRKKHFKACRILLKTDGVITPNFALNHDFRDNAPLASVSSTVTAGSAKWDDALWDTAEWPEEQGIQARWIGAKGVGYCSSVRMRVSVAADGIDEGERPAVTLQVNSFDLIFEKGNIL